VALFHGVGIQSTFGFNTTNRAFTVTVVLTIELLNALQRFEFQIIIFTVFLLFPNFKIDLLL
jgi:hypothetical protein